MYLTYEGLKHPVAVRVYTIFDSLYLTYEGLKLCLAQLNREVEKSLYLTYEGLKPENAKIEAIQIAAVCILPMRD